MAYLVPVLIILFSMSTKFIVELSSELSTNILVDTDAGIDSGGTQVIADQIVDMRPETSSAGGRRSDLPDLLVQDR
jgi:hypothetical protein